MRQFILNRPTCSACGRGKCSCLQLRRNAEGDPPAIDFAALAKLLGVQADPRSDPVAYIGELRDSLGAALADDSEVDHAALAALLGVEADPAQAVAFAKELEAKVGEVVAKLGGSAPAGAADAPPSAEDGNVNFGNDVGTEEEEDMRARNARGRSNTTPSGYVSRPYPTAESSARVHNQAADDFDDIECMTPPVYNHATKQVERKVAGRRPATTNRAVDEDVEMMTPPRFNYVTGQIERR